MSGEGVQQALLKIIEGTVASVPPTGGRKHPHQQFLEIDTSGILFIAAGAFAGIEDIVKGPPGPPLDGLWLRAEEHLRDGRPLRVSDSHLQRVHQ